jgi:hypothetical protein
MEEKTKASVQNINIKLTDAVNLSNNNLKFYNTANIKAIVDIYITLYKDIYASVPYT